tara:strand:+ start:293 stop:415 length:123 start_codon:yes stop_codon:yes gene_type:complete
VSRKDKRSAERFFFCLADYEDEYGEVGTELRALGADHEAR